MDMLSTKQIGTVTEYECAVFLMKLGCSISVPIGENNPYDLIVDVNNKLYRIQCKHSRSVEGGFQFSCESTRINATSIKVCKYSTDEIDYFGTIFEGTCYLVPVGLCRSECKLRTCPPKNGQLSKINWAKDYEASVILQNLRNT